MNSGTGTVVLHDPNEQRWLLFRDPVRICSTHSPASVPELLREAQAQVDEHALYAAGFLAYEAAPGFDPAFKVRTDGEFPLAWFGLYDQPRTIPCTAGARPTAAEDVSWEFSVSREEYEHAIHQIRDYIRQGETYQVNYSTRLRKVFAGDPWLLFRRMVQAQGPHYAAFVDTGDFAVACASPELFFRLDGPELVCRPMKGTAPRGHWPAQDRQQALALQRSEKNRAENVMIVDMVRNDLGRVARTGTVGVEELFRLEKYPTLWQMTSTVRCQTAAPTPEILRALFPAASITGAPKIRTMQLIAGLERSPRRIYTGSIGFIAPGARAQFNVAIRTVLLDRRRHRAEYGVGGGIVWDSRPASEFEECRTKARILTSAASEFSLFETMLWTPAEGFFLLENHLQRLAESAGYFSKPIALDRIRRQLEELARGLPPRPQRIRLVLQEDGGAVLESHPMPRMNTPYRVRLAIHPIASDELFLYHKTTQRRIYEQALAACPGFDDVLLWNQNGELTEATIANLVVARDGRWLTPPIECGLLAGTYRALLLEQKRVKEAIIRVEDLAQCSQVFLINSLRGLWEVSLAYGDRGAARIVTGPKEHIGDRSRCDPGLTLVTK